MKSAFVALALSLASMAAAPAVAGEVKGFEPIKRGPLPGERALEGMAGADFPLVGPGMGVAEVEDGNSLTPDNGQAGVRFSSRGDFAFNFDGAPIGQYQTRRTTGLLGNRSVVYESDLARPYNRYGWTYGLGYNQSWVGSLQPNDLAGLPSVRAPLDFWSFRR